MAHIDEIIVNGVLTRVNHLDSTAQEVDDAVAASRWQTSPNLLDNWYFANPVNQRGQTEYTAPGFTVDRWKLTNPNGTLSVGDDGIALFGRAGNIWLQEHLENEAELYGKQVTLSVIADGMLYSATGIVQAEAVSQNTAVCSKAFTNATVGLYKTAAGGLFVQLHAANTKTVVYYAVKLELGTQQTLAHQDADGNWVLNEIPDYGEELAKCQRHQLVLGNSNDAYAVFGCGTVLSAANGQARIVIPTPVSLRARPTLSYSGNFQLHPGDTSGERVVSAMTLSALNSNAVEIQAISTNLTIGMAVNLKAFNDVAAKIILDANL